MPTNSPELPTQFHSNEIERRLTTIEILQQERLAHNEERWGRVEKRMSLLEKTVLAIAAGLQILLQDKYPLLASILKGML